MLVVLLLVKRLQVACAARNSIHQDQIIPFHPSRWIRHDLRSNNQMRRIAFESQSESEVDTRGECVNVIVIGNR